MSKDAPRPPAIGPGPEKILAIGIYGESVAAYRYLVLSEKAPDPSDRKQFADMSDEEQSHKQRLQRLAGQLYPHADFVLNAQDKLLVVEGPRLLEIRDQASFAQAMKLVLETERRTAAFYAQHGKGLPHKTLRDLFHELAEEGAEHHRKLRDFCTRRGLDTGSRG
jgi:rubrerythrin